mmetsp:Transcript_8153/g.29658  ORF Transcript_8153/g.29658 Transcript_8153/m.29658 type:complete len:204 (-) Transcript_8153:446-1057(-)
MCPSQFFKCLRDPWRVAVLRVFGHVQHQLTKWQRRVCIMLSLVCHTSKLRNKCTSTTSRRCSINVIAAERLQDEFLVLLQILPPYDVFAGLYIHVEQRLRNPAQLHTASLRPQVLFREVQDQHPTLRSGCCSLVLLEPSTRLRRLTKAMLGQVEACWGIEMAPKTQRAVGAIRDGPVTMRSANVLFSEALEHRIVLCFVPCGE